ncbi:MAG: MoaD/ThiS family protein [Deltaproteobacteria bacterium]|nr:MoaD/ThiS family protein [Deltaproteobacteria bacterium]
MVTVRFFAMLKGLAKTEIKEYDIKTPVSLDELKSLIKRDFPALKGLLESRSVLVSINQEFAEKDAVVKDGDEVGFAAVLGRVGAMDRYPGCHSERSEESGPVCF